MNSQVLKKCAACRAEKPVSEMKTCMHNQMHNYVCDSKCMNDFYNTPKTTPAPIPDAAEGVERLPDSAFQDEFQAWWEDEGQYVRAGGGNYERSFAFQAWRHLMPKLVSALRDGGGVPEGFVLIPVKCPPWLEDVYDESAYAVGHQHGLFLPGYDAMVEALSKLETTTKAAGVGE